MEQVLTILKKRTHLGVTSQELRNLTHSISISHVISLLRAEGYVITEKSVKVGSTILKRYWLSKEARTTYHVTDQSGKRYRVINNQWIPV